MRVFQQRVIYLVCALLLVGAGRWTPAAQAQGANPVGETAHLVPLAQEESVSESVIPKNFLQIISRETIYDKHQGIVICNGKALAKIGGQNSSMEADTIIYDKEKETIEGVGNFKITRNGMLSTGASCKFKAASPEYLITRNDCQIGEVRILSRTVTGSDKYLRFRPWRNTAVADDGSAHDIMPQFAKYRLGGIFGNSVRGFRSFSDLGTGTSMLMGTPELRRKMHLPGDNFVSKTINNNIKWTAWCDYGHGTPTNGFEARPVLGTKSLVRSDGLKVLPNHNALIVGNRYGSDILYGPPGPGLTGDFPRPGLGWRMGKAVAEPPYTRVPSPGLGAVLNGVQPWVY